MKKNEETISHLEIIDDELRRLLSRNTKLRNHLSEKTLEEAIEILEDKLVSKMTENYEKVVNYIEGKPLKEAVKHLIRNILPSTLDMERARELNRKKCWRIIAIIFISLFLIGGCLFLYFYVI